MIVQSTPLALAVDVNKWFPEYEGRVIAVADCVISKENKPILPLVMIAFTGEGAESSTRTNRPSRIIENVTVEFWQESVRYKLGNGAESPFYAYIDYRAIRDKLLSYLDAWVTPDGSYLAYQNCNILSDEYAYTIQMNFKASYEFCPDAVPEITSVMGVDGHIGLNLIAPFQPVPTAITSTTHANKC